MISSQFAPRLRNYRQPVAIQIGDAIDDYAAKRVAAELEVLIPIALQEEVIDYKRQLEDVKRNLFNSLVSYS